MKYAKKQNSLDYLVQDFVNILASPLESMLKI